MSDTPSIRWADEHDLALLVSFRLAMFRDMGWTDEARLGQLAPLYETYVREASERGDFVAWIAESGGRPVGSVAVLWERVPPTVRNLSGRQAYVLALYVVPEARRRGVATVLLDAAVRYAKENGADVVSLHFSPAGKGLYERFGFVPSPEMRLFTDPSSAAWSPSAPAHVPADDVD